MATPRSFKNVSKMIAAAAKESPIVMLSAVLLMSMVAALSMGTCKIPLKTILSILVHQSAGLAPDPWPSVYQVILFHVRLPRVLLGALVGGSLALSGAVMQGLFKNPMADPGIIGVSSGGALGAVIALSTGVAFSHFLALPAFAFLGSSAAVLLVYSLATRGGRTPVAALLLSGIAVGSLLAAMTSFLLSLSTNMFIIREMLFWILGGLDGSSWKHLAIAGMPTIMGSVVILSFSRELNIMALEGEEGAMSLGINVRRVTQILLVLSALITGAVVSVSGVIGFVGLIVPHAVRLTVGPNHRMLLPASFLGGAVFIIWADVATRCGLCTEELRLGVVTALVGSPFFLLLLQRNLRRGSWM